MKHRSILPPIVTLLLLALFVQPTRTQDSPPTLPSFPGAEGFGAIATGGRGGQVIYVTTLDATGPGSLQAALDTPGPRTIVFSVSGVIDAAAEIRYGDVTIAGQTSPGGIIVRGIVCDGHYEDNDCDNLIIQHIRSRPAFDLAPSENYILDDALRLDGVENVMIDHLSLANANDEAVQISMARNVTIQNSILAETVGEHYVFGGMLINYSHSQRPQDNLSIHHNMWHRIGGRTPEISCELSALDSAGETTSELPSHCGTQPLNIEVASNLFWDVNAPLVYNSNLREGGQADAGPFFLNLNYVNNFYYVRPAYPFGMVGSELTAIPENQLFISGNQVNLYPDFADLQLVYCCNDFPQSAPNVEAPAAQILTQRHPFPHITNTPAAELMDYMQANVGAFPRDAMDSRYLAALASGQIDPAPLDQPAAEDAFALNSDPPAPPVDTDLDGMPDAWEIANGLDPATSDHNGTDLSVSLLEVEGYTNLEVYLHLLAESLVRGE